MIKLFRRIRQRLLSENKFSKYILYAIGEIILVVIGILIALQINNWNESRKANNIKKILISNLLKDFEDNNKEIKSTLKFSDSLLTNMKIFRRHIDASDSQISTDSLKSLMASFMRSVQYFPELSTYEEAKSNGNLSLVYDKELFKNFNDFLKFYEILLEVNNQSTDAFFKGSTWELKKSTGGLRALYLVDDASFRQKLNTNIAKAAFENMETLQLNIYSALKEMESASEDINTNLKLLKN